MVFLAEGLLRIASADGKRLSLLLLPLYRSAIQVPESSPSIPRQITQQRQRLWIQQDLVGGDQP
jgi:hypothetical protein